MQIAAVLALGVKPVPVGRRLAGRERVAQRPVKPQAVRERVRRRLLAQRVEVIDGDLEGDHRLYRGGAVRARRQRREDGGRLGVQALLAQGGEGVATQSGVGNRLRDALPAAQLSADPGDDGPSIDAQSGHHSRHVPSGTHHFDPT